jgi:IS30 family transposase
VVCRELWRNPDQRRGEYRAGLAQRKADARHLNKPKLARFTETVKVFVESLLEKGFSPEQATGGAENRGIGVKCAGWAEDAALGLPGDAAPPPAHHHHGHR